MQPAIVEEGEKRPRSAEDERRALIRAYAEHGMAIPRELEAQKPRHTSDKSSEGEHNPRKADTSMDEQLQAPAVDPQAGKQPGTNTLSRRAIERSVDGGVLSVFALITVTLGTLISNKING